MTATLRKMRVTAVLIAFVCLAGVAVAQEGDQVAIGRTITVAPGETRGDIACVRCSVYVRGTVKGDIAVMSGRIVIDGAVTGDVAIFWGDVRIGEGASVGGDIAAMGAEVKRSPTATVRGSVATISRGQALAGMIVALACTIAALGLFIWLLIWLVRRRRAVPAQPVARRA